MSSKREEERNEKIIRGLMKLPPNRRCINCNSLGPQYVCTNFWTFIWIACSGIHREFTHRVKSVSMAKFTIQEVEALQRGGNQHAREIFLKDWDTQQMRLPDSSNADRIREFLKNVYVDKKYIGERSSDKPPRDMQSHKNHEEDHRRASSYHSFSQSPPYEHQYEDRRYGKQIGVLTRKPGSDRGYYEGKVSSFVYSPGPLGELLYEDRFANEVSGSKHSDYTLSSIGDRFRSDGQSPNFQNKGYSSPPSRQLRDVIVEDAQPHTSDTYIEANIKKDSDGISRPQDSIMDEFQKSAVDVIDPDLNLSFESVAGSAFPPSVLPPTEGTTQDQKSTNPFDLPCDPDLEPNNVLLDMSSLQATLPNPQLQTAFLGIAQSWLPQNHVSSFVPSIPQGGLDYIAGQAPSTQLP